MIRLISIKNFRSIQDQTIKIEEITTFVGNNDAGKSNILRALNLFFNQETDHNEPFNFKSDFNINAKVYKQRAKEIVIELGLKLPPSYRREGYPNTVSWKKVWRESGEHGAGEIKYCILEGERFFKKADLPSRSKIQSLLSNINYIYVPAIKDKSFFIELQGKIYDVLAQVAESGLHSSANLFEEKIQTEFNELLIDIDSTFENKNSISLPKNLRAIFENLEFNSDKIPLSRRGDGIKVRHIPAMLRFIGEKSASDHKTLIAPQIWGFEEPENNVEFSSCFALSKQFIEAAKSKTQVILTTHSPAIYNIADSVVGIPKLKAVRFYVTKDTQSLSTELSVIDDEIVHDKIGFMPLIAPLIAEKERIWFQENRKQAELIDNFRTELAIHKKHRIFVEGKSDKEIFLKVIEAYTPELIDQIYFDVKGNNCANSAADRAKAFQLTQKHNSEHEKLKGVLILDNDPAGILCKRETESFLEDNKFKHIKIMLLDKPPQVFNLIKKGFDVVADLESCLPIYIWRHALENGWLEEKTPLSKKFTKGKTDDLFNSQMRPDDLINEQTEDDKILINYSFTYPGKESLSKYISSITTTALVESGTLENFKTLFEKVNAFIID